MPGTNIRAGQDSSCELFRRCWTGWIKRPAVDLRWKALPETTGVLGYQYENLGLHQS